MSWPCYFLTTQGIFHMCLSMSILMPTAGLQFAFLSVNTWFFDTWHPSSNQQPLCSNPNVRYKFPRDESRLVWYWVSFSPCDLLSISVNLLVDLKQEICCHALKMKNMSHNYIYIYIKVSKVGNFSQGWL